MSLLLRPSHARGHAHHGWLDSRHTFSFADYHDSAQMGFSVLRVINEDVVDPTAGFAPHGHRNMEIITYVIEGALEHRDDTGAGGVIRPGDVQAMSAGAGVRHSEYNASSSEPVHFLQIWILPNRMDEPPRYAQRNFDRERRRGRFCLIASPDGKEDSLSIRQDARVYTTLLDAGERAELALADERKAWVQMATGSATINGVAMTAGDGAAIESENHVSAISSAPQTQILVFDLP